MDLKVTIQDLPDLAIARIKTFLNNKSLGQFNATCSHVHESRISRRELQLRKCNYHGVRHLDIFRFELFHCGHYECLIWICEKIRPGHRRVEALKKDDLILRFLSCLPAMKFLTANGYTIEDVMSDWWSIVKFVIRAGDPDLFQFYLDLGVKYSDFFIRSVRFDNIEDERDKFLTESGFSKLLEISFSRGLTLSTIPAEILEEMINDRHPEVLELLLKNGLDKSQINISTALRRVLSFLCRRETKVDIPEYSRQAWTDKFVLLMSLTTQKDRDVIMEIFLDTKYITGIRVLEIFFQKLGIGDINDKRAYLKREWLYNAILDDRIDFVEYLFSLGMSCTDKDLNIIRILTSAKSREMIELVLKQLDIEILAARICQKVEEVYDFLNKSLDLSSDRNRHYLLYRHSDIQRLKLLYKKSCETGDIETVSIFLEKGFTEDNYYYSSGIRLAVAKDHIEIVKLILEKTKLSSSVFRGLLEDLVDTERTDVIKLLPKDQVMDSFPLRVDGKSVYLLKLLQAL